MKKIIVIITFLMSVLFVNAQEINQFDANNKRHGVWEKKFNNGRIRYQGEFNHGKETGVFKFYSAADSKFPTIVKEFNANDNTASVQFFSVRGVLESKGKMEGKNRIGKWVYFHKNGKTIMQEETYVNNKLDGEYKTFYPSLKPTVLSAYKNGKLQGSYKRYSISNFLYQDLNYVNGVLEGKATYYDRKTGNKVEEGQYKNDERVGSWDYYIDGEFSHSEEVEELKEVKH